MALHRGIYGSMPKSARETYDSLRRQQRRHLANRAELDELQDRHGASDDIDRVRGRIEEAEARVERELRLEEIRLNTEYAHLETAARRGDEGEAGDDGDPEPPPA